MATRFYLSDTAADVSPSTAAWNDVDTALIKKLVTDKTGFPSTGGFITTVENTWTAGNTNLCYQGVSDPMSSGLVFTGATFKCQVKMFETALQDNVVERLRVWIVSQDGTTERVVLLSLAGYGNNSELNQGSLRNETVADGDATGASYTTVSGDRLVIEIGFTDSAGTTPAAFLQYRGNSGSTDLPENETETTNLAAWFETSVNITFGAGGGAALAWEIGWVA